VKPIVYVVNNADDFSEEEETEKANNSFGNNFVHLRHDDGSYYLVVIPLDPDPDYVLLDESSPQHAEIMEFMDDYELASMFEFDESLLIH